MKCLSVIANTNFPILVSLLLLAGCSSASNSGDTTSDRKLGDFGLLTSIDYFVDQRQGHVSILTIDLLPLEESFFTPGSASIPLGRDDLLFLEYNKRRVGFEEDNGDGYQAGFGFANDEIISYYFNRKGIDIISQSLEFSSNLNFTIESSTDVTGLKEIVEFNIILGSTSSVLPVGFEPKISISPVSSVCYDTLGAGIEFAEDESVISNDLPVVDGMKMFSVTGTNILNDGAAFIGLESGEFEYCDVTVKALWRQLYTAPSSINNIGIVDSQSDPKFVSFSVDYFSNEIIVRVAP